MRAARFDWTAADRVVLLEKLYLGEKLAAGQVAERFSKIYGMPVARTTISRKVFALGLTKKLDPAVLLEQRRHYQTMGVAAREARRIAAGKFHWNEDRLSQLRQMYLRGWTAGMIAKALGCGCTDIIVRKRLSKMGLSGSRDTSLGAVYRSEAARKGGAVTSAKYAALREARRREGYAPAPIRAPRFEMSKHVEPDMRALIDAAIAAGKVTVLPSGRAAGLSALEQQFGPAQPGKQDWKTVTAQNRKAAFYNRRRANVG